MSGSAASRPQAAEEARGGGAREPRAVAGLLRGHGHAAHVSVHRAVRDQPGGQGQVRRAVRRPVGQLRRPDHRAARHHARGVGARRAALGGGHRRRHRARREGRAVRGRRRRGAGRRRAGRARRRPRPPAPTTNLAELRGTRSRRPSTPAGYAGAARYEIDERGLVVHIVADAVLFDAEEADPAARGPRDPRRRRTDPAPCCPTCCGSRATPTTCRSPPGGLWPSNWELSAYRATTVLTLPGQGRRARAADVADRLRAPPGRWSPRPTRTAITVNRRVDIVVLSTASAEANALLPGLDAVTSAGSQRHEHQREGR